MVFNPAPSAFCRKSRLPLSSTMQIVTCTLRFWASDSAAATMVLMAAMFRVFLEGRSAAEIMGIRVKVRIAVIAGVPMSRDAARTSACATEYAEGITMNIPLSRRTFLRAGAAGSGSLLAARTVLLAPHALAAASGPVPASERVRFGMIGIGMQGSGLLGTAITLPGVECVAAADLYDGRHTLAKEITGNPNLPTTRHYQELLDRKDIDCIVAAVPDHWHKRVVVDACNAGKDIYCEKPMSHAAAQGFEMDILAGVARYLLRKTHVARGGAGLRNGGCRAAKQTHRADRVTARQLRVVRQGARAVREWRDWRRGDGGIEPRPQRSHRRLAVPATTGSVAGQPGLGDLAERRAANPLRCAPLRTLALLEGVRDRRGRRSHGSPHQRHAVHLRVE